MENLVRVTAPHFVAGIVVKDDICIDAAPILKYCKGKDVDWLSKYFQQKGWEAMIIRKTITKEQV